MSFLEVETWKIREGDGAAHHEMIRRWFRFVKKHYADMFQEWKSARYYRQTDREGQPTGRYIMIFEFHTRQGHHTYKERRKDWSGPYEAYKTVDPYQFFDQESVTIDYWEPQEVDQWFEFD